MTQAEPFAPGTHTCTRACRAGTHAIVVLATPSMQTRDVWQQYAPYARRHGWHVREVVRLPHRWLTQHLHAWTVSWRGPWVWIAGWGWVPTQQRHAVAWRIWIAPGATTEEHTHG